MSELNFDCVVCEGCGRAMNSSKYWHHDCNNPDAEWSIKPVANVKQDNNERYLQLEEELTSLRERLDDVVLEIEQLEDKEHELTMNIRYVEEQLAELEEEDNDD